MQISKRAPILRSGHSEELVGHSVDLRLNVLSGLAWLLSARVSSQIANWAMTLFVIRILAPGDYGLMPSAMAVTTVVNMVAEFGIGDSIVKAQISASAVLRESFGLSLAMGAVAGTLLWLLAVPFEYAMELEGSKRVLRTLSVLPMLTSIGVVPRSLLALRLDFKRHSVIDLASNLTGGAVTLVLALQGFGVWSLIYSALITAFLRSMVSLHFARFYVLPSFRIDTTRKILRFSLWLTLTRIVWSIKTQVDVLIVGLRFDAHQLGTFFVGRTVAQFPNVKTREILNLVGFPAYCRTQSDQERSTDYLIKYVRLSSLVFFPVYFGIAAIAPVFVDVVLSAKWADTSFPIRVIAFIMPLVSVRLAMSSYLMALGHIRTTLSNLVIELVILVAALIVGSKYGFGVLVLSWSAASAGGGAAISIFRATRAAGFPAARLIEPLVKGILVSSLMYFIVVASAAVPWPGGSIGQLGGMIAVGIAVQFGTMALTHRLELREAITLFVGRG